MRKQEQWLFVQENKQKKILKGKNIDFLLKKNNVDILWERNIDILWENNYMEFLLKK